MINNNAEKDAASSEPPQLGITEVLPTSEPAVTPVQPSNTPFSLNSAHTNNKDSAEVIYLLVVNLCQIFFLYVYCPDNVYTLICL